MNFNKCEKREKQQNPTLKEFILIVLAIGAISMIASTNAKAETLNPNCNGVTKVIHTRIIPRLVNKNSLLKRVYIKQRVREYVPTRTLLEKGQCKDIINLGKNAKKVKHNSEVG